MTRSGLLIGILCALLTLGCDRRQDDVPPPQVNLGRVFPGVTDGETREPRTLSNRRANMLDVDRLAFSESSLTHPGYTFVMRSYPPEVMVLNIAGEVVHRWEGRAGSRWTAYAWNGRDRLLTAVAPHSDDAGLPRNRPPAGEELVCHDWMGVELWRKSIATHHDLDALPDGGWITLAWRQREIDGRPLRDEEILILDPDGGERARHSLWDILSTDQTMAERITAPAPRSDDGDDAGDAHAARLLASSIAVPPSDLIPTKLVSADCVAVTLRRLKDVVIVDLADGRLRWSWRTMKEQGRANRSMPELRSPIDLHLTADGHLLLVDAGVWKVDPLAGRLVWELPLNQSDRIAGAQGNAAHMLPDGSVLLTDVTRGRVREFTREGRLVWDYRQNSMEHQSSPFNHAFRVPREALAAWLGE